MWAEARPALANSYRDNTIDGTGVEKLGLQNPTLSPPDTSNKNANKRSRVIGLRMKIGAYIEKGWKFSWDKLNPNVENNRTTNETNGDDSDDDDS